MATRRRCEMAEKGILCTEAGTLEFFRHLETMEVVKSHRCPAHSRLTSMRYEPVDIVPHGQKAPEPPPEPPKPVSEKTCPHGAERCLRCSNELETVKLKLAAETREAQRLHVLLNAQMRRSSELADECGVLKFKLSQATQRLGTSLLAKR